MVFGIEVFLLSFSFLSVVLFVATRMLPAVKVHIAFYKKYRKHSTAQAPQLPFNYGLGQLLETNDAKGSFGHYVNYGKVANEHGGIVIGHYGPEPWVIASHPALVKQLVLASPKKIGKGFSYDVLKSILGNGLVFTTDHEQWKKQRHTINPLFTPTNVQNMYQLMQTETLRATQSWSERVQTSNNNIELCQEFSQLTLAIVSACAFGLDYRNPEHKAIQQDVTRLWNTINSTAPVYTAGAAVSEKMINLLPLKSIRELKSAIEEIRQIGMKVIEERRRCTSNDKLDLMTFLLEAKQKDGSELSEAQMIDEIIVFLLAGHETTSGLLSFMFYLFATNPEVTKKAKEEVATRLAETSAEELFSFQGVQELTYLDRVINETLRLYPPVYVLDKIFLEDGYLVEEEAEHCSSPTEQQQQPKKHFIQKGTMTSVNVVGLHRNPAIWENPNTFDPDRWAPERLATLEKKYPLHLCFVPFSTGHRSCIGKLFATVEAKLITATILHKFNFELNPLHHPKDEQMHVETGITIRPASVNAIVTHC